MSATQPQQDEDAARRCTFCTSVPYTCLWLLWAVLLFGGMAATSGVDVLSSGGLTATRMASSVSLVAMAWLSVWAANSTLGRRVTAGIAVGITLGAVGDFFLAGWLQWLVRLEHPTIGGIVAFGLGHIAYIAACTMAARRMSLNRRGAWAVIAVWQVVGLASWYACAYLGTVESARPLVWPALGYTLLLAGTAGITTALALRERRLLCLAIGAALFLLSDLLLAVGMFHDATLLGRHAVWATYGIGQMLIVISSPALAAIASDATTTGRRDAV